MECSRCGTQLRQGLAICPVCGAQLREKPQKVRCRYCGHRFSAELSLCPHCGRESQPGATAPIWWISSILLLTFAVICFAVLPPFAKWRVALADLVPGDNDLQTILAAALPTLESAAAIVNTATITPTATVETLSSSTPESTPTAPVEAATLEATAATLPTTPQPSSPTPTTTATPVVTPAAAPGSVYVVEPGDTPGTIARRLGVSLDALIRANDILDATQLQVGQRLLVPATGAVAPVTATSNSVSYTVAAGDTLATIARRFGITVDDLVRANNIQDTTRLQINQQLIIPSPGGVQPTATATPAPPPTVAPTPTVAQIYLAPQLINPADTTPFSGGDQAFIELRWQDIGPLQADEVYVVHLGYLVAPDQISWFYEDTVQGTSWRVPVVFQSQAPQETGRAFRWYVQVEQIRRDSAGKITGRAPRSPRSPVWGFSWS